jgi:hypothetical protein
MPIVRKACFPGPIQLGWSGGQFSLVTWNLSIPRLRRGAEKLHYGRTKETGAGHPRERPYDVEFMRLSSMSPFGLAIAANGCVQGRLKGVASQITS